MNGLEVDNDEGENEGENEQKKIDFYAGLRLRSSLAAHH